MTIRGSICSAPDCDNKARSNSALGLACTKHYQRVVKHGTWEGRIVPKKRCTHPEGCDRKHYAKGYCGLHWGRLKRIGKLGPVGMIEHADHGERVCGQCGTLYAAHKALQGRCTVCLLSPRCVGCHRPSRSDTPLCAKCYRIEHGKPCSDCGKLIGPYASSGKCQRCGSFGDIVRRPTAQGYVTVYGVRDYPFRGTSGVREHHYVYWQETGHACDTTKGESVHHMNGQRHENHFGNLELWSSSQPPGQRVSDKIRWALELLALYGDDPSRYEHDVAVAA